MKALLIALTAAALWAACNTSDRVGASEIVTAPTPAASDLTAATQHEPVSAPALAAPALAPAEVPASAASVASTVILQPGQAQPIAAAPPQSSDTVNRVEPRSAVMPAATPSSAPVAPAAPQQGPAVSSDSFSAWLETVGSYSAGKPGQVRVVLTAKAPFKCNAEYPYKFTFGAPPSALRYPSPTVRTMQIGEGSSNMLLPIEPVAPDAVTISGALSFSVCTKEKCLVEKQDLSLPIQIH